MAQINLARTEELAAIALGAYTYRLKATMDADTTKADGEMARVNGDTAANNGLYVWDDTGSTWDLYEGDELVALQTQIGGLRVTTFDPPLPIAGVPAYWALLDDNDAAVLYFDVAGKAYLPGGLDLPDLYATNLHITGALSVAALAADTLTTPSLVMETDGAHFVEGVEAAHVLAQDADGQVACFVATDGKTYFPGGIGGLELEGLTTDSDGVLRLNDHRVTSSPDLWCIGDSHTALSFATQLGAEMGRTSINDGVGGQLSGEIAARVGARITYGIPSGNSIPTSGAVSVTLLGPVFETDFLRAASTTPIVQGWFGGVYGTMTRSVNAAIDFTLYTFTRATAGSAVATDPVLGAQFVPDVGDRRNLTAIIWIGRNDNTIPETVKQNIRRIVASLAALKARFVILTILNANVTGERATDSPKVTYDRIIALNDDIIAEWPYHTCDIRTLMADGSADDVADPSLFLGDNAHYTSAGYQIAAEHVARFLNERGW